MKPRHLTQIFADRLKTNQPLAPYTYIKIGGPAEWLLEINHPSELSSAITAALKDGLKYRVFGSASNVLIADRGLPGLVIINRASGIRPVNHSPYLLSVDSGTLVNHLVNHTLTHQLQGLEEFLGLPGTVGGAIYNNSHHLNHLIGDHIKSVTIIDHQGKQRTLDRQAMNFGYDQSRLQTSSEIVTSVVFTLKPGNAEVLKDRASKALQRRRQTQPLSELSSGCMFKNPASVPQSLVAKDPRFRFAGFLIEQAGCKGLTRGGAMVSSVHANFIVNRFHATAADIIELSNLVKTTVAQQYNVELEREVFVIDA